MSRFATALDASLTRSTDHLHHPHTLTYMLSKLQKQLKTIAKLQSGTCAIRTGPDFHTQCMPCLYSKADIAHSPHCLPVRHVCTGLQLFPQLSGLKLCPCCLESIKSHVCNDNLLHSSTLLLDLHKTGSCDQRLKLTCPCLAS